MPFGANIKKLREHAGISVQKLADRIGVDAARMRKWEEKDLTPRHDDIVIIEDFFKIDLKEISKLKSIKEFLIIQNSTLAPRVENLVNEQKASYLLERRNKKNTKEFVVPFYDAGASAGNELSNTETSITDPVGLISVGHFLSDAEAAIRIYGNSMMSNYPPGCILGISQLKERIIQPGEVYVVETEEQRIFKRLFYKNDDPDSDTVMCYSDNIMVFEGGARVGKAAYPPFYVPLKTIRKINVVLGVVKRNTNLLIR